MSRGIIDLIQENKRRFYKGEIRNLFYEEPFAIRGSRQRTIIIENADNEIDSLSFWQNLKTFGQKFTEDLFYEPAK